MKKLSVLQKELIRLLGTFPEAYVEIHGLGSRRIYGGPNRCPRFPCAIVEKLIADNFLELKNIHRKSGGGFVIRTEGHQLSASGLELFRALPDNVKNLGKLVEVNNNFSFKEIPVVLITENEVVLADKREIPKLQWVGMPHTRKEAICHKMLQISSTILELKETLSKFETQKQLLSTMLDAEKDV